MRQEQGFTLVELLIVIVVLAILVAIGVPSYLGQKARAENIAAEENLQQAVTPVRAYYLDNGTFVGMTVARLRQRYDRGFPRSVVIVSARSDWYCLRSRVGRSTWYKARRGQITTTRCR